MRLRILVVSMLGLLAACTSADRTETISIEADSDTVVPGADPADTTSSDVEATPDAGESGDGSATVSFVITDDEGTTFEGQYSASAGLTYALDPTELGFSDVPGEGLPRVVINAAGTFISSDLYASDPDVPGDLWVIQEPEPVAAQLHRFFAILVGDLERIVDSPGAIVEELAPSGVNVRYSLDWVGADDPYPSFTDIVITIDGDGHIVEATIAQGGGEVSLELFDHGVPVDVPIIDEYVTEDELYEQITIGDVEEQTGHDLRGASAQLDQALAQAATSGTSLVLVVVTDWCSSVCDEQVRVVGEAMAMIEDAPPVVLIVGGSLDDATSDRFAALTPSATVIVDGDDVIVDRSGVLAVPAMVLVDSSGEVIDTVIGVVTLDDTRFFLEGAR